MMIGKILRATGGLLLVIILFGTAIAISMLSPEYLIQSITLMGFVLTYIGIRISLTDSEDEREESLHTKFNNRTLSRDADFILRITDIHVHERGSLLYKIRKYLSPRGDFEGVSEFEFEIEQGELPSERVMWERFSDVNYLLEIRKSTEDLLIVCFASADSYRIREQLQDLIEWINTTSISPLLKIDLGGGNLCETKIEYFPARSHLFERLYRRFFTKPKQPSTGDLAKQIGYWVHDRKNRRHEFGRWPRVKIERTTLPIPSQLGASGLHEVPNHTPELFTYTEPSKVSHQLERAWNEFEGKWITVTEDSSGQSIVQMSVKTGIDDRIIRKCPIDQVSFAPLDYGTVLKTLDAEMIAVQNHNINIYYPITENNYTNRYVVLKWNTDEDIWVYEVCRIDRETLREPWVDKEHETETPPKEAFAKNPGDYAKIIWKRTEES